jgi:hypothetical protein
MNYSTSSPEALVETFENNSSELYWLAYLLTGNTDRSVQAFDKALDFDEEKPGIFGEFLTAWARKLVIVEALGAIDKELRVSAQKLDRTSEETTGGAKWARVPDIAQEDFEEAVIAIDAFPRCAMLLTIFEGMSIKAASILLNAGEALTSAAQRIGIVQLTRNLAGDGGRDRYPDSGSNPVPVLC